MAELGNDSGGNFTFITTFDGKLVQRVEEGVDGAVSRALTAGANEGKIVWEKHYNNVTGMITAGEIAVKEFSGKKVHEIQVKLDDNIVLQLPMHMLSMFAKPLPNVDITRPVKISVYKNKMGKMGLSISQEDPSGRWEQADWAYTRDEPNGLPQAVFNKALDKWNFDEHDTFLIGKVNEFFGGALEQMPVSTPAEEAPPADELPAMDKVPVSDKDVPADFDEYDDDIPF